MRPGEEVELRCYKHLKEHYTTLETGYRHEGGMDSTKSDIAAIQNGKIAFYIEAKDALAQSGQFVLLADEQREVFVFSPRNRSKPSEMTDVMISYMNSNFQHFRNAGTAGKPLDIDPVIFSNWIVEHYKGKNVKYVISYDQEYVIFPIRKFAQYFHITANYRTKKSGSGAPAKKDIPVVEHVIEECYPTALFSHQDKKLFVNISETIHKDRFISEHFTYYLSRRDSGKYEVRRLSNTYNMNVIFSIKLVKKQDPEDLKEFISDIQSPDSSQNFT